MRLCDRCSSSRIVPNTFFCVTGRWKIRFVGINQSKTEEFASISGAGFYSKASGDFDANLETVYWMDSGKESLSMETLDGGEQRYVVKGFLRPRGVAVDWVSSLLYFTDDEIDMVGVSNLDGSYPMALIVNLADPYAIALDPEEG